jgi:hypothetical protein
MWAAETAFRERRRAKKREGNFMMGLAEEARKKRQEGL